MYILILYNILYRFSFKKIVVKFDFIFILYLYILFIFSNIYYILNFFFIVLCISLREILI